jgi:uncharacterized protein YaeQ
MTKNIETMKILESNNKISKNKVQSMLASYRNNLINVDESKIDKFIDSINNQNVIMANILNKKDVILSDVKQKKQINIINIIPAMAIVITGLVNEMTPLLNSIINLFT